MGDTYANTPDMYLAATSIFFLIPLILTLYNRQWLASSACALIMITSTIHHSTRTLETIIVDKFACYYLATVSMYYAIRYNILYIVLPLSIYTLIVYYYGYYTNTMAWCEDSAEQTRWHSTIHIFVALSAAYGSYVLGPLPKG